MRRSVFVVMFGAAFALLLSCSQLTREPTPAPILPTMPTSFLTSAPSAGVSPLSPQVDAFIGSFIGADTPGAAVLVIQDGAIVHSAGYGLADVAQAKPIEPGTIFHLASTGKQFTGLALVMLAEAGMLRYDDPAGMYLPELAHFGQGLTLRRLLQHTSGVPDYYDDQALLARLMALDERPTNAHALTVLAGAEALLSEPGEQYAYSNTGYEVLGSVIEKVSGQTFAEFMQASVFGPLGMTSTFSQPAGARLADPNLAHSYLRAGDELETYDSDPLDNLVGAGSVYSTIEDMARYDAALYTDQLVSQAALAEAFKPAVLNSGAEWPYGFGWVLDEHAGRPYVGHEGSWLAFTSYYVRFPRERLSVLVLLNRDYGVPEGVALTIADFYLNTP